MNTRSNLCLVAVLLGELVCATAGCSTQVAQVVGQSESAVQQSRKQEVVVRFVSEPAAPPKPNTGHTIFFESGKTAFGLGDYYYLLRTTDGGHSWQQLRPAPEDEKVFGGRYEEMVVFFRFLTPTRGWMSAERGIWQTEDGVNTWRLIFPYRWQYINFVDSQHGSLSVPVTDDYPQNYVTWDGGETWHQCGVSSGDETPCNTHFLTSRLGWGIIHYVKDDGFNRYEVNGVARTSDGGCHWQRVWVNNDDPYQQYTSIYFLNEREGWLAGEEGLAGEPILYQTADGGRMWKSTPLPNNVLLATDIYFVNSKEGWIVTRLKEAWSTEVIFHTIDGGKTWRQLTESEIAGGKFPSEWKARRLFQMLHASRYNR